MLSAKRLELFHEMVPAATTIGVLRGNGEYWSQFHARAQAKKQGARSPNSG
jgi:ABC-type uncharacterized transport system substrate-binding protein